MVQSMDHSSKAAALLGDLVCTTGRAMRQRERFTSCDANRLSKPHDREPTYRHPSNGCPKRYKPKQTGTQEGCDWLGAPITTLPAYPPVFKTDAAKPRLRHEPNLARLTVPPANVPACERPRRFHLRLRYRRRWQRCGKRYRRCRHDTTARLPGRIPEGTRRR